MKDNIACLDFSGGYGANPLCAYRWDGEAVLKAEKFVTAGKAPCGDLLTEAGWRWAEWHSFRNKHRGFLWVEWHNENTDPAF
jgi:hypothetical protein